MNAPHDATARPEPGYEALPAERHAVRSRPHHSGGGDRTTARFGLDTCDQRLGRIPAFVTDRWDTNAHVAAHRRPRPAAKRCQPDRRPALPTRRPDLALWRYTATRLLVHAERWNTAPGVLYALFHRPSGAARPHPSHRPRRRRRPDP